MSGIDPTDGLSAPTSWMDLLQRHGPKKIASHAAVGFAAYQLATPLVKRAQAWHKERTTYTITVNGTDNVYDDLHEWVLRVIPSENRKALVASTDGGAYDGLTIASPAWSGLMMDGIGGAKYAGAPAPPAPAKQHVRLRYDGSRTHKVKVKGHQVSVGLLRDEVKTNWNELPHNWRRQLERVVFTVHSSGARDAVVEMLEELAAARQGGDVPNPPLYISDRWGSGWDRRDDLPRRTLDSVILPDEQLADIVGDLGKFLGSEEEYNSRTLPWHRGYLFYGPPGTGKTSVVKALAEHFRLPLYYLPLADLRGDGDLVSLVSQVGTRSILLLEDVDVFHAARDRDDDQPGVTLSALLNALDGIWTPHGLVTFMTTNHREALDSAILRPGRVDMEVELSNLTAEQAAKMHRWFHGRDPESPVTTEDYEVSQEWCGRSPAELLQYMTIQSGMAGR